MNTTADQIVAPVVPSPAGVRGKHIRCGCGASWFGKNAMDTYRRHWLTKHAPQPINPPHEEES